MKNSQNSSDSINVFIAYSHKDAKMKDSLVMHLKAYERLKLIKTWHDKEIKPGDKFNERIDEHLDSSEIILLLISKHFIYSDYCCNIEMKRALKKHELNESCVIPIILKRVDWRGQPFGNLQVLPENSKPVQDWKPHDNAYENIAQGIRKKIDHLMDMKKSVNKADPDIIVDINEHGDYSSIPQAVAEAKPGDCIHVKKGLYKGTIIIDKPLTIVGDGRLDEIEIRTENNSTIIFNAAYGTIKNLKLRLASKPDNFKRGRSSCIDIQSGRLNLEECDISSESDAGIIIHNDADPILRKNQISNCSRAGVLIMDEGRGLLEENSLSRNSISIVMKDNSEPILIHNSIKENRNGGVIIGGKCSGLLEQNNINNNLGVGVSIEGKSKPKLIYNDISDNCGEIYVSSRDIPQIVEKNKIHNSRHSGIVLWFGSKCIIEDNDIYKNKYNGVEVYKDSEPILRGNSINRNEIRGIRIFDGGFGIYESNHLRNNNCGGLKLPMDASRIKLSANDL